MIKKRLELSDWYNAFDKASYRGKDLFESIPLPTKASWELKLIMGDAFNAFKKDIQNNQQGQTQEEYELKQSRLYFHEFLDAFLDFLFSDNIARKDFCNHNITKTFEDEIYKSSNLKEMEAPL